MSDAKPSSSADRAPERKAPAKPPAAVNAMMTWMLRSPLSKLVHGQLMLLTVTGRKTGREYTFPVQYVAEGDVLWVITGGHEDKTWWRNLRDPDLVTLLFKRQERIAKAQAFTHAEDPDLVEDGLRRYADHFPGMAKRLGIRPGDQEAFHSVAATTVMVRVQLS